MAISEVLGSTIHYEDDGGGTPFVFLHGNPTSSYLWRNVTVRLGVPVRRLAPDLIGMGRSGKPDIAYSFDDHGRYLETWIDGLGLERVVLVGHDWGGALAFDWAARHPDRVRGIAFFETILRPMTWERDFPGPARARIESLRAPGTGETKVLEENFFIEQALRATVLSRLADDDLAVYRAPYPTPESRRPLLSWPRAFPIEGRPADVHTRVRAYDEWLAVSAEVPKLLLTFDGPAERLIIGDEQIAWCREHVAALEVQGCGPAAHAAPEDQPAAIAAALTDWAGGHALAGAEPVEI